MLYICATPIGNLNDLSFRAAETLKNAELILAEDTRVTSKLLKFLDVKVKMLSYHEHNKSSREDYILQMLRDGKKLVLVTDAGMPGISDPGGDLISLCIENNIDFEILPGASAVLLGVLYSGFETANFYFEGFLPPKSGKRKKRLMQLKIIHSILVFYEAPHRVVQTLCDILEVFGDVDCSVSRELTKLYQETYRARVSECINKFSLSPPKGEFVLTINNTEKIQNICTDYKVLTDKLIAEGYNKKEAIKLAAQRLGVPKRDVYNQLNKQQLCE